VNEGADRMSTPREAAPGMVEQVRAGSTEDADREVARVWRLQVRAGSLALILSTLIPSSDGKTMLLYMDTLTMYALGMSPPRVHAGSARNLLFLFSACSWTILLTGWLGLWISRSARSLSGPPSRAIVRFARGLFFATWLLPCLFSVLYSFRDQSFDLSNVLIGVAVYLLGGGQVYFSALRNQGTPFLVFWLMLPPIVTSLFGWACIATVFLFSPPGEIFAHEILLGGGGALLMLVGLVGWWRALRRSR